MTSVTRTTSQSEPNWIADATVLSFTGEGCGSMPTAARSGVLWRITQTGNSLTLDQDMRLWPTDDTTYTGSLTGTRFTATYVQPQQVGGVGCRFQGGELSGSLSEDGLRFDAIETNVWLSGSANVEVRLQRHWTSSRL